MNIEVASLKELNLIKLLYKSVTIHLKSNGVSQWDRFCPNRWVIRNDLKKGHLHAIINNGVCTGAVVVDEDQSRKYANLSWSDQDGRPAVIHRLAVQPDFQGNGIGKKLLHYAEELAKNQGCTSIRLDAD